MKKFFKFIVLLMFIFTAVLSCNNNVSNEEPEEQDDLTLLDLVTRNFSDEEIDELTQAIENPYDNNYIFSPGSYKCQFLITSESQGVKIIESCIFGLHVRDTGNGQSDNTGTLSKHEHDTVLIASTKSAKLEFNSLNRSSEHFDFWEFKGWRGLIGYYTDTRGDRLWGYALWDIFQRILKNASVMYTNTNNDKFYIHKTQNNADIQICITKQTNNN